MARESPLIAPSIVRKACIGFRQHGGAFVLVHLLIDPVRALTALAATDGLRRNSSVESRFRMTLVMGMSVTNGLFPFRKAGWVGA